MQSRETRFVLRIESGEREGEQVALGQGVLQVGRRPECELCLKDASVSGRHAELRVTDGTVELIDHGSTNGTRVGARKVERVTLAPGDEVHFGHVRTRLLDAASGPETPAPSLLAPPPAAEGSALGKVSADKLTRSAAGSRRLLYVLVPLVLLAGGAFFATRALRSEGGARAPVAVPEVPGNLLADGSLEESASDWTSAEAAPAAFLGERFHARSGRMGLGASLEAGAWSLVRSPELVLHARRSLSVRAALRADTGVLARLGVELASASAAAPTFIAWAPARRGNGDFAEQELAFDPPGGFDRARIVVAAAGPGAVAFDDVAVLEQEPLARAVHFTEYELAVLGAPGSCAALVRSGRTLLTGFDLASWTRAGLEGFAEGRLEARASARGFTLTFAEAPPDAHLAFSATRPDDSGGAAGSGGWVSTTGTEGYAAHGDEFTRSDVTGLLLGNGTELLRIGFERPVEVVCSPVEGALSFRIAVAGLAGCELQLSFGEERAEASALADRALESERRQDYGAAVAAWSELLDRFPFERKLVAQASEARARLVQEGLGAVDRLRREMVRARFFLLPELFRQGREQALALAERYRGSEVEADARKAAQECAMALTELSAGARSGETQRLEDVLTALEREPAPRLAAHVRDAIQAVGGDGKGD